MKELVFFAPSPYSDILASWYTQCALHILTIQPNWWYNHLVMWCLFVITAFTFVFVFIVFVSLLQWHCCPQEKVWYICICSILICICFFFCCIHISISIFTRCICMFIASSLLIVAHKKMYKIFVFTVLLFASVFSFTLFKFVFVLVVFVSIVFSYLYCIGIVGIIYLYLQYFICISVSIYS